MRLDFEEVPRGDETSPAARALADDVGAAISDYDVLVLSDYAKGAIGEAASLIERGLFSKHEVNRYLVVF